MDSKKIGKFIAKLRKENGMTQEDLAKSLYTDRSIISKWERGLYIPKHDIILKISNLFNVSVNELYYGERQNSKNKNKVNEVTINIIKENKLKTKKIISIGIIFITMLILLFFVYYFINNYNSISVYTVSGETRNFGIYDGLIVVSREKSYIQLGDIKAFKDSKINSLTLYYIKDNKEHTIFSDTKTSKLLIKSFSNNELFTYSDLKCILNNLYLKINFDNNKSEIIELTVKRDFINNSIFNIKNETNTNDNINKLNNTIPTYIKDNFKLNEDEEKYYLKVENGDTTIIQEYYYDARFYIVEEKDSNKTLHFEYHYPGNISYYSDENNLFTYVISEKKCTFGECNQQIIDYFIEEYINKIKFEG